MLRQSVPRLFSPTLTRPSSFPRMVAGNVNQLQEAPPLAQQIRFRWTKAKKKRQARFERRSTLQEQGKELPKPPYFFDINSPVVNAIPPEARQLDRRLQDEEASARLAQHLSADHDTVVLRHAMTGLKMSDRVAQLLSLTNGNQKQVVQAQKQRAMSLFERREADTGSSAVQVVALTTRIQQLQAHLGKHKKDKHSKRGLDALYVRRRKLLDYMERKDFDSYRRVVKTLGLVR